MIRLQRFKFTSAPEVSLTPRVKVLITISNALMLLGVVMLLYVGGIYADAEYSLYAARGDTDVPAPQSVVAEPEVQHRLGVASAAPAPFIPALLNITGNAEDEGRVVSTIPQPTVEDWSSSLTRIAIPAIDIDSKIVTVGWDIEEQKGKQVAVWQVAEYAVGHHVGSANPGSNGNIVLAGHVGGYGKVFKDLIKLKAGDQITLYSNGQQYLYIVSEQIIVNEEGVSAEQQAKNAQYIQPTNSEVITMITCWPPTGKDRFTQRVIVQAVPFHSPETNQDDPSVGRWNAR
jgi:sortase A